MGNKGGVVNKKIRITIIALFLASSGMIALLFFGCIRNYSVLDERYLDLTQEYLTFEKYEQGHGRSGWYFALSFKEYEEPFRIDSVTSKGVNRANLNKLAENDILKVTFCQNFDEICEISCNGAAVLSLSDYIKVNESDQITGMLCCLFVFLCVLFLAWIFLRALEPIQENAGLGRMRIEYMVKGNVIRIYHSIHVCSLVINDQIFDQHHGVYGSNFSLKGRIGMMKAGGKTIHVEAKMGLCHMRLYCNGQLVAKKFMAFG